MSGAKRETVAEDAEVSWVEWERGERDGQRAVKVVVRGPRSRMILVMDAAKARHFARAIHQNARFCEAGLPRQRKPRAIDWDRLSAADVRRIASRPCFCEEAGSELRCEACKALDELVERGLWYRRPTP